MQLGVALPNFGPLGTRDDVVEIARRAEALGYDSIWTTDHVMMRKGQEEPYGHILEAVTTLTYVAALTERIRLGISVIVLPQREPVLVAKQTATLDVLSGGRLIVGLGAGWNEAEFRFMGATFENRGKRMDEYIRAIRELWTAPDPRFEGQYVRFSDVLFSPRPLQPNGPKIVIGGPSPAALRRAAQLADGWHPVGATPERVAEGMQRIRELANGRAVECQVRLRTAIGRPLEARGADGRPQGTLAGSPDEVRAKVELYRQAGVQHIVAGFAENERSALVDQMASFVEIVRDR